MKLSIVFICLLASSLVNAQEDQYAKYQALKSKIEIDPNLGLSIRESRLNREKQKYSVLTGGGIYHSELSYGVQADYILKPEHIIGLHFIKSKTRFESDLDPYSIRSIGIHHKRFHGNSFYGKIGVAHRHINYEPIFSNQRIYKYRDFTLSASIGNQWSWRNFTLGADWFGVTNSIIKLKDTFDSRLRTVMYRQRRVGIILLNFYLGASF